MWIIVRRLSMKASWWDPLIALQDLAGAAIHTIYPACLTIEFNQVHTTDEISAGPKWEFSPQTAIKHPPTTRALQTTKIKWGVCFSLTKDSLYQTLRSKSYLPLRGNNPRPLDVNFEILTTTPLWYTQWENFKTLYYTKSNSCSDTLLSFHFLGVIRHNFALEFYTHSPEFLGWSIMIKFHHFRNFLIKIFLFNIQSLVIEMFKVINNIAATIIDDLFTTYHSYNLRSKSKFVVPSVRTVHNGQNSIQYYGSLIWNMIVGYIKYSEILGIFKGKIRK